MSEPSSARITIRGLRSGRYRTAWESSQGETDSSPYRGGSGAAAAGSPADPLATLERLADLHDRGALTDEEFTTRKRELFPAAP